MKVSQLDQACVVGALFDFARKFIFRGLCSILAAKQAEFWYPYCFRAISIVRVLPALAMLVLAHAVCMRPFITHHLRARNLIRGRRVG